MHSGAAIKTDDIISKVYDDVQLSLCPGSGIFKTFAGNIIGTGKKNFLKQFLQSFQAKKMILSNNSDQTCFSDILTSAGPRGRCWKLSLKGEGFNTSLGAQQMLMHRKSCLILKETFAYQWPYKVNEPSGLYIVKFLSHLMTKPTKWLCAQQRLRSAWASTQSDQSSPCAQWVAKDTSFLHADSEDSDQTGRMHRLIWVFAGRKIILLVLSRGGSFLILQMLTVKTVHMLPFLNNHVYRAIRALSVC